MKLTVLSTAFVLLLVGVFSSFSALMTRTTDLLESEARDLDQTARSISAAQSIKSRILIHNRNEFLGTVYKDPQRISTNDAYLDEIKKLIEISDQLVADEKERIVLEEVKERVAVYLSERERLKDSRLSPIRYYELISKYVDAALDSMNNLVDINRRQMSALLASTERINKAANQSAIILLSVGGLITFGVLVILILKVVLPLITLRELILKYDTGNGDVRAPIKGVLEIRSLSENFNLMSDRLEQKRQDQLRFIAAIAHDLRNPLSSMAMASELLISGGAEKDRNLIEIIFRQVKHLNHLVGDLLDTTRIEAGQLAIETSELDLSHMIRDAIDLYKSGDSLHDFKVELPKGPLLCKCDQGRISQVINNLISNAIKYSPNGGTITLRAQKEAKQIAISVADQGIGIAEQDLANIFKPFQRTKATKETIPGIGLGLSTSRRIVEAHAGTLKVESQLGKGSIFYMTLPAQLAPQSTPHLVEDQRT